MRKPVQRERTKSTAYNVFYCLIVAVIICVWIYAFKSYFSHYDSLHPAITWAVPWVQIDVVPVDGILLWNEDVMISPRDGTVKYPLGKGPVRVPRGTIVARVSSGNTASDIKAHDEGYFVAGVDGMEDQWRYPLLWPGMKELPDPLPIKMIDNESKVRKGDFIGKLIPQPQELRFIGYIDFTNEIESVLRSNKVMVKMDPLDTSSQASVRVFEPMGHKVKVYLNVPWFPPQVLSSRKYKLLIETGETAGVAIPESAVGQKDGKKGAYVLLRGSDASFVEIQGRAIDDSRFLVTEGLKLGDAVIVDGYEAREGKVRLW